MSSLLSGVIEEIFRGLLGHEEKPILFRRIVRDDPHSAVLGTFGLLDHKLPTRIDLVLVKLLPVIGRPPRIVAASEPKIDFLELLLWYFLEVGAFPHLVLLHGIQ